jgi:hypothetical protein
MNRPKDCVKVKSEIGIRVSVPYGSPYGSSLMDRRVPYGSSLMDRLMDRQSHPVFGRNFNESLTEQS